MKVKNLYAIAKEHHRCGEKVYLYKEKYYKVWKIINKPEMRIIIVDELKNLSDWDANLFTFKEV